MFLLRMKNGASVKMRAGKTKADPVLDVGPDDYTEFAQLPPGISRDGDAQIEVHAIKDGPEAEKLRDALLESVKAEIADRVAYRAGVKAKIDRQMGRAPALPPSPKKPKPIEIQAKIDDQTDSTAKERQAKAAEITAGLAEEREDQPSAKPAKKKGWPRKGS